MHELLPTDTTSRLMDEDRELDTSSDDALLSPGEASDSTIQYVDQRSSEDATRPVYDNPVMPVEMFDEMYDAIQDRLFAFVYRYVHNVNTTKDALQTTALKLLCCNMQRGLPHDSLAFRKMCYQTAMNTIIDGFRRARRWNTFTCSREEWQEDNGMFDICSDDSVEETVINAEIDPKIVAALSLLPDESRLILQLTISDKTITEIAQQLHISYNWAKTKLYRTRLAAKALLAPVIEK